MTLRQLSAFPALLTAFVLVASTGSVSAQQAALTLPRLEVRGGVGHHGAGDCFGGGVTGPTAGLDVRTHGTWITSAAVDVFLVEIGCLDIELPPRDYKGQLADVRGWPLVGPRLTAALGYGFSALGVRSEITAELGIVRTKTDYGGPERDDVSWRPWHGGALTVRFPSGLGLQFELGRHRLAERYYVPDQDVLIAEVLRWERMWRISVSFPIIG